jgi:hypothetical protein
VRAIVYTPIGIPYRVVQIEPLLVRRINGVLMRVKRVVQIEPVGWTIAGLSKCSRNTLRNHVLLQLSNILPSRPVIAAHIPIICCRMKRLSSLLCIPLHASVESAFRFKSLVCEQRGYFSSILRVLPDSVLNSIQGERPLRILMRNTFTRGVSGAPSLPRLQLSTGCKWSTLPFPIRILQCVRHVANHMTGLRHVGIVCSAQNTLLVKTSVLAPFLGVRRNGLNKIFRDYGFDVVPIRDPMAEVRAALSLETPRDAGWSKRVFR